MTKPTCCEKCRGWELVEDSVWECDNPSCECHTPNEQKCWCGNKTGDCEHANSLGEQLRESDWEREFDEKFKDSNVACTCGGMDTHDGWPHFTYCLKSQIANGDIKDFIRETLLKERSSMLERIRAATVDVVPPPENAKDFMGDWERGVVTGGWHVKERIITAIEGK